MTNPQGTSFIPQRPTKGNVNTRRVRKVYVLSYISYVLFFGSVLAAAGVFFLNLSLNAQLERQKELLAKERQQFNQGEIESVRDLDKRIKTAEARLNNHVSVLSVLEALERSAVQSIDYLSFSYKRNNDEAPVVTFMGDAQTFDSVLFQRSVLESNPVLAGSRFTEVALQTTQSEDAPARKMITFTFEKEVDPNLIGYTPRGIGSEPEGQNVNEEQNTQMDANAEQTTNDASTSGETQTQQADQTDQTEPETAE